jgi:dTDP-4-amino-4,6-dideoxygalactose transaminase
VTEEACATVLSLPCYPGLTGTDQDTVIEAVRTFFGLEE